MDTYFYLLFTLGYIILFVFSLRTVNKDDWLSIQNVLLLVILALIYDNLILGIGRWIGEGAFLETLNVMRYWLHAFFTPLLILFSWDSMQRVGIGWVKTRTVFIFALVYTIFAISVGLLMEVIPLSLQPEWKYGVLSYTSVDESSGPPVMILLVTLALIIGGIALWRKIGWKWLLIGILLMTVGSMASFPVESEAITNLFELILLTSLVFTKRHLKTHRILEIE